MILKDVPEEEQESFLKSCLDYYSIHYDDKNLLEQNPFQISVHTLQKYSNRYLKIYQKEPEESLQTLHISKPNFILKAYGIQEDVYLLYRNQKEKILVAKYCYQTYLYQIKENLISLREKLGSNTGKIKELAIWYGKKLGCTEKNLEEEHKKRVKQIRLNKHRDHFINSSLTYDEFLTKLMTLEKEKEIIKHFKSKNYNLQYVIARIPAFVTLRYPEQKDFLFDDLKRKVKIYQQYLEKQKRDLEKEQKANKMILQLQKAKELIEKFTNNDTLQTKEEFCKQEHITTHEFDEYLKILNGKEEELEKKAHEKLRQNTIRYFMIQKQQVTAVIECLKNGVLEQDVVRPLNLLDYYFLTKMSFKDFDRILKLDHPKEDIILWKKWEIRYRNIPQITYKSILRMEKEIECALDKNNRPIKGSGRMITDEEKGQITAYLNHYHIPINQVTYTLAIERFQKKLSKVPNLKRTK